MDSIGILSAFIFGLLSFVSPCVLPIVPGYLSFISGVSFDEFQNTENRAQARRRVLTNSLFFVIGFSLVFIALGASATTVGKFLQEQLHIFSKVAGVIIIIFGLHMMGVLKIPFLNYEKRFHSQSKPLGVFGSLVAGLAFAFGWTPCIGPILAGILTVAAHQETVDKGILLLSSYSAGLGIPFLLTGVSLTAFQKVFNVIKHQFRKIEIVGGVLLVIVGVLIFANMLTIISGYLLKWFPVLGELG